MELINALMDNTANWAQWAVVISMGLMGISSLGMIFPKRSHDPSESTEEPRQIKEKKQKEREEHVEKLKQDKSTSQKEEKSSRSWTRRLSLGLSKTRQDIWTRVQGLLGKELDAQVLDEVEEILYSSDMSASTIDEVIEQLKKNYQPGTDFKKLMKDFFESKLAPYQDKQQVFQFSGPTGKTKVIMIVGVNGAGKTTTIGKLATKLKRQGAKVVVGACDTFRAAAIEQLEVWCERAGVELIKTKSGADPSGVAYESLQAALNAGADYCLLDTAGRLHTKANLMDELNKTKRVLAKLNPSAPHEVLLVIDSITGQNALRQSQEFHKYLDLTGLILTKCDGSSKAGNAISMVEMLKVPIVCIGVGEDVDDLNDFDTQEYLDALIG